MENFITTATLEEMIEDVLRHYCTETGTEMDTELYRKLILNIPRVFHKIEAPYERIRKCPDESEKDEVCWRATGSQTFGSRSLIKEWLNAVFYEKDERAKLEYALNPL